MARTNHDAVAALKFTDEDVEFALSELTSEDRYMQLGSLTLDTYNEDVIKAMSALAKVAGGTLRPSYGTMSIVRHKSATELRSAAEYNLRNGYGAPFKGLREVRAAEQGLELTLPDPEPVKA